jgi:hypothetical protein
VPQHCFCVAWLLAGTKTCSYKEDARRRRPNPISTPPTRYATFPPLLRVRVLLNPPTIPSLNSNMPRAAVLLALAVAAVLATIAAFTVPTGLSRACVLDASGHLVGKRFEDGHMLGMGAVTIPHTRGGDHGRDARRETGNRALRLGTQSMLNHVVTLSKETATREEFLHQHLGTKNIQLLATNYPRSPLKYTAGNVTFGEDKDWDRWCRT